MKKSLFRRLISTYVLVIFLSIVIVSSVFYIFFNNYYLGAKEQQLFTQGREISKVLSPLIKNKEQGEIDKIIEVYNRVNVSHMWVTNKAGHLISGFSDIKNAENLCVDNEQVLRAIKGEEVTNRRNIKYGNEPVLSVALPIYVDGDVQGVIYVCNPLSEINSSILQALRFVIFAGGIAITIVAFVSYFISKTITKPIKEITEISLEMASGNFVKRANVTSTDEIGKLGNTFNYMIGRLDDTLKALEDEKNKMIKIERMQREFVANASHELRTPLTSVRGYLEAMLDGVIRGKEEERKYLRIILSETLRMHRLVNSLLDLSRIESGQIKVNKRKLAIGYIVERIITKLKPLIEDQQLGLEVSISKGLPLVLGDEDLIEQVLINYIANAVRFTPVGGKLSVKAESDENKVKIHIIDTGIGILEEDLSKVWKRFYKINEARPLSKEGAGLGLSLVKEIMELLGGEAWVESIPGKGSTFSFSLSVYEKSMDEKVHK
ncbi:sensor histidine kinase [Clostridium polyendosporum]|uniref:histidine kinase n=1 Tax=Clostridium polyendosporum TaxID=69208 RepID=A0A919RX20_9CLOT|nr:ATP-binding protein [Clostridium polyendosporum]GIM27349.1 sensor histidine kinase [Clostridium polyendosporum]